MEISGLPLVNVIGLCVGTFLVTFFVAAVGPTGGLQLATVAVVLPPSLVIPLHACINGFSGLFRAINLRNFIDWRYWAQFSVLSLLFSSLAMRILWEFDASVLQVLIGAYILVSVIAKPNQQDLFGLASPRRNSIVSGVVTGFTTVFVGATGPLLIALMKPSFSAKESLQATHAACLTVQHFWKIALFSLVGISIFDYWAVLLLAIVSSWIGTQAGYRVLLKISEATYRRWLRGLLILAGLLILVRGILSLAA